MRTVSIRLADLDRGSIPVGFAGENQHTQVRIDCKKAYEEYPTAVVSLIVKNPHGDAYPAVTIRDGDIVSWNVTNSDLAYDGTGEIQLTFTVGEVVKKSYVGRIRIEKSILSNGEAPDPIKTWIDEANEILDEVEDAIPAGGTTGQVLAKKSDSDRDTEWVDQTGGGGTSDYDELENRPQIAGVTLTGDVSLHDLGAAAESDIPDVSGFYTKPSGGIPDTDLASGVQTSLGKADSAYQKPSGGIPSSDMASAVQTSLGKADSAYQKPVSGIPAADIEEGVIPDPASIIDDTAGSGDTGKAWSADKVYGELDTVKSEISQIQNDLYQGESETYTGTIAVIDGQTEGASIGITPGNGVNNIYHTKKNLFNLFNRTKGTITEYGASSPRAFSETEYYNGFNGTGINDGDGYGVLEYITDGIALFQGATGGGGGHGTIFPLKIPAEKPYTLSLNIYGEVKVMYYNSSGVYQSTNTTGLSSTSSATDKTLTFTPPSGTYWTVLLFQNHKTRNHQYKNVMLVEGESSETYEECSFEKLANNITSVTAYAGKNKIWSDAGSFSINGEVSVLDVLDERIDDLDDKTEPLENDVVNRNLDVLPAVHACVGFGKSVGGVLNSEEGWGMLITTDVHARETVMQNAITYFNKYPFLHIGMCLGDMAASNYAQTDGTWYTNKVNTAAKPWYTVLGNHDGGNSTDGSISATVGDQFTKWIAPTLTKMGMPSLTVPYYAVHNTTYGVSAIFLDCYDVPDTKSGNDFVVSRGTSAYSQAQINWFISELNNVPSGHHLLIFQHGYTGASTKETCAWSQAYNVVNNISSYGELIPDIVNAWVTGGTLSDTYTTEVTGLSSITVSADFTSRGTGVFAGYVVGHYHRDLIAHSTKYSYQKIIALCCTADGLWQGENSDLPRVEDTKSQDCLTVLCVNKTRKTVNLARVGANWTISMTQRIGYAVSYDNS